MKTTTASKRKKRIWRIILILLTALGFSYLYTRGVSPVWAAIAIVFLQGILPVPLRDSLPSGNAGHHRRHTEFSNLLNI